MKERRTLKMRLVLRHQDDCANVFRLMEQLCKNHNRSNVEFEIHLAESDDQQYQPTVTSADEQIETMLSEAVRRQLDKLDEAAKDLGDAIPVEIARDIRDTDLLRSTISDQVVSAPEEVSTAKRGFVASVSNAANAFYRVTVQAVLDWVKSSA